MLIDRNSGGAIVEFALLLPALFFLFAAGTGLGILVFCQFRLERFCGDTARLLAASSLESLDDLNILAQARVPQSSLWPVSVEVGRHTVPSTVLAQPRDNNPVEVIELTLRQTVRIPFFPALRQMTLLSHAWEGRIQP